MADDTIRVGVVGLGSFGAHHARHYAANPRAWLVAVADADPARARDGAARYGVAAFQDYRELVGHVDAVSVTVPATHHHAVAGALIDAGVHVLIEKPITRTSAEARDLVARAARRAVILQVGHLERFSPVVAALRERVSRPRRLTFRRRTRWTGRAADVDVILDLMIHDIDLALMLARAPVASIAASGVAVKSALTDEAEAWLTFTDGAIATLSTSRVADENERHINIAEPDTTYRADIAGNSLSIASRSRFNAEASAFALTSHDNLGAEIDAFLACVTTGSVPDVDGNAGLAALEIAERIQAAIADADATVRRSV